MTTTRPSRVLVDELGRPDLALRLVGPDAGRVDELPRPVERRRDPDVDAVVPWSGSLSSSRRFRRAGGDVHRLAVDLEAVHVRVAHPDPPEPLVLGSQLEVEDLRVLLVRLELIAAVCRAVRHGHRPARREGRRLSAHVVGAHVLELGRGARRVHRDEADAEVSLHRDRPHPAPLPVVAVGARRHAHVPLAVLLVELRVQPQPRRLGRRGAEHGPVRDGGGRRGGRPLRLLAELGHVQELPPPCGSAACTEWASLKYRSSCS